MAVTRDDQNTFLMIGGVLIVCIIALIAVVSSIWALIRAPVNSAINTVSNFIRIQSLDYNFTIPVVAITPTPVPTPSPTPINIPPINIDLGFDEEKDIDYNFTISSIPQTSAFADALYTDSDLIDIQERGETPEQKNLSIQIPLINVNSPVVQGIDSESLIKEGFWVVPSSRRLGQSEVIFLCNRRYFGPDDPKSCWFLDKVGTGNYITVKYGDKELTYSVVGVNTFSAEDPLVYQATEGEDLIRIVTTDPLNSNENRLVILAERVL